MSSVFDSDGEFLLIEAAEVLPLWVQPKNSENRVRPSTFSTMEWCCLCTVIPQVWIYNSRLHLIPLSHSSPPSRKRSRRKMSGSTESDNEGSDNDDDEFIAPDDAVKLVRGSFVETLAPPLVEKAVWERISGFVSWNFLISRVNNVLVTRLRGESMSTLQMLTSPLTSPKPWSQGLTSSRNQWKPSIRGM
jgi:hypothetical protein